MKDKKERRSFDKEFKKAVVHLITKGGRQISEVALDLDIHPNVIHRWKREYISEVENISPVESHVKHEEEEELLRLRKKLAHVTEERDILKKALAIVSNRCK